MYPEYIIPAVMDKRTTGWCTPDKNCKNGICTTVIRARSGRNVDFPNSRVSYEFVDGKYIHLHNNPWTLRVYQCGVCHDIFIVADSDKLNEYKSLHYHVSSSELALTMYPKPSGWFIVGVK